MIVMLLMQVQVSGVWQSVLTSLVTTRTSALSYRRETVRLRSLREGIRRPVQPTGAHSDSFGDEELRVCALPAPVRAQVLPEQALQRGWRLLRRHGCRRNSHCRAPVRGLSHFGRWLQSIIACQQRTWRRSDGVTQGWSASPRPYPQVVAITAKTSPDF